MKYHVYFECCGIESSDTIDAPTAEEAVRMWENEYVSDYVKTNFGLFFLQSTYEEMRAAAHAKDSELVVKEIT